MKKALVLLALAGLLLGGCVNINVRPDDEDDSSYRPASRSYDNTSRSYASPMVDVNAPGARVRVDRGYGVQVDR